MPGGVLPSPIPNPSGKQFNSAQEFRKGIKRDKGHYTVLKDEKEWDDWKRGVESTATTHGCENVLDPVYIPNSVDDVALFDEQQKFMYDVFFTIMKTDRGNHFVRTYNATKDAQRVWRDYCDYMQTSTRADLEID